MSIIYMDVKQYLEKYNYSVVANVDAIGCIVSYPSRIIYPQIPEWFAGYSITKTGVTSMALGLGKEDVKIHTKMPAYTSRVYVMLSIMAQANIHQIPSGFVVFTKDNQKCSEMEFFTALPSFCTKKTLELEKALYEAAVVATKFGMSEGLINFVAKNHIEKGFNINKTLLENK